MRFAAFLLSVLLASSLQAVTVNGRITECFPTGGAPGFVVKAFEQVTFGLQEEPGVPSTTQTQAPRHRGTVTTGSDGSFSISYLPTRGDPRLCLFQLRVHIQVCLPDGTTLVHRSLKKLSSDTVTFDVVDVCSDPCPLSAEGPAVIEGEPGRTVSFDASVFLGMPVDAGSSAEAFAWQFKVPAIGATITGASHAGTAAEQAASARAHVDPRNPFDPIECRNGPVATSVVAMSFDRSSGLAVGDGPQLVFKVSLQAEMPSVAFPTGESKFCRVFFNLPCTDFGTKCFLRNEADDERPITRTHELRVELRATQVLAPNFRRADANASGAADISDAIATFEYLFLALDKPPPCLEAADSNGDGAVDISDGVNTLTYLFGGGKTIPAPGPNARGPGDGEQAACASYNRC